MTAMTFYQRMAFTFGVAISLLQAGRAFLWWRGPQIPINWFTFIDAYLVGALLISGAVVARRKEILGRSIITAGWGFSCGILYRSFFEQLEDSSRHAGHELLVLACKGMLLGISAAALVHAVAHKNKEKEPNQASEPTASSGRGPS